MPLHKSLDSTKYFLANKINYMSTFTDKTTFMGFIPAPELYCGIIIDDVNMMAIHLHNSPCKHCRSDEEFKEQEQIDSGKLWLVVIYGSDNSSFMKRFKSESRARKWIEKTTELHQDDTWLWYNS